ncbi:MAG: methylmalonyl Co-A mutase-associated GTPase MeaB [Magnetococcales bacterium]|nr:methylmalonyl Co-A mutase-associated GTPase MeaB [Magnetococcales bacterium]
MKPLSPERYIEGVRHGNRRILGKAITLLESRAERDRALARQVLKGLTPHAGNALRVAVSGPPGAGKSTFVEAFGLHAIGQGSRVGVLAIDPSSRLTGGSILGDKLRMPELSLHPDAYIRPSPAGEDLGGVARRTREAILVLEAAGFDLILVETVGVGQSETVAAGMTDLFMLLALPNAGDEIQGIKRGMMEFVHLLVVNKADGAMQEAAEQAAHTLRQALHLMHPPDPEWTAQVITASARTGLGLEAVWQSLQAFRSTMLESGRLHLRRREQSLAWMWELVREGLEQHFRTDPTVAREQGTLERAVTLDRMAPGEAADQLLAHYFRDDAF